MKSNIDWDDEEIAAWVGFDSIRNIGFGSQKMLAAIEYFESMKAAWKADVDQLRKIVGVDERMAKELAAKRKEVDLEGLIAKCKKADVRVIPVKHPDYPYQLKHIYDPPAILYTRGNLPDLTHEDSRVVAVVGTRRCTSYGQNKAREIAKDLVEKNIVVVSGMAIGIDSFVHNACVNAGGKTVAVLACGPDIAYPSSNKQLYNRIINEDRGAVVSEYMPGIRPEKWRFPQRNRIVSGMSRAVIVIEAGQESGALITAKIAFEQNRDVFAIPGRTDNLMSMGTNKLIAHTKAHMIRHVGDFMYKMNWIKDKEEEGVYVPTIVELYGREKDLYEYLSNEPLHFDALLAMSNMSVGELSSTLTMLEIAGVVKRDDADFYQRVDLMV